MTNSNKQNLDNLRPLTILLIVITIIWVASIILMLTVFKNWNDRSAFGDSFGAINSLFSGLAFSGIIYTILLQRKELALQRQELADTREELKRAADAQEKSEKTLNQQMESMRITAKLNALNTLVNTYLNEEEKWRRTDLAKYNSAKQTKEKYLNEIEHLLDNIDISNNSFFGL